jgi:lipopolysaccharide transport system ATP-binding protein
MIDVRKLGKRFRIYSRPADRLAEWSWPLHKRHSEYWALRDVSLRVERGASMGVVGANGSGKSTLLKIIAGASKPTEGSVSVDGRVGALLELGMGFHAEFSGRDNVLLNGLLLGISRDEIEERIPEILAFSELGDFFDRPLRTYSSGMVVRLGFSVAACMNPQVLVIDEALSVGDAYFQQKCARRLKAFRDAGATLLCVSHDPMTIKNLCQSACLLDEGRIVARGAPDDVLDHYTALQVKKSAQGKQSFVIQHERRSDEGKADQAQPAKHAGNFLALVSGVELLDAYDNRATALPSGASASIRVDAVALETLEDPTVGIVIRDRLGNDVFGTNSRLLGQRWDEWAPHERVSVDFRLDLDLGPGNYTVTAAIHAGDSHFLECYDWVDKVLLFEVLAAPDANCIGLVKLKPSLTARKTKVAANEVENLIGQAFPDAPSKLTMGDELGHCLLKGWYGAEGPAGDRVRWTSGEAVFVMNAKGAILRVVAGCPRNDVERNPSRIALFAEGEEIGRWEILTPDLTPHDVKIPADLSGRTVLYRLVADPVWTPSETGEGPDGRRLGVLAQSFESIGERNR